MSKELREWYEGINEEDILPNGAISIKVPVVDADSGEHVTSDNLPQEQEPPKSDDPVVEKDKHNSLKAFVCAKRIQDLLIRVAGLTSPYEEDSETRQAIVDKIKELHRELGEEIASL